MIIYLLKVNNLLLSLSAQNIHCTIRSYEVIKGLSPNKASHTFPSLPRHPTAGAQGAAVNYIHPCLLSSMGSMNITIFYHLRFVLVSYFVCKEFIHNHAKGSNTPRHVTQKRKKEKEVGRREGWAVSRRPQWEVYGQSSFFLVQSLVGLHGSTRKTAGHTFR